MLTRLFLFLIGVFPILLADLFLVKPGIRAGATFAALFLIGLLVVLGLLSLIGEPLLQRLLPKTSRKNVMSSLALGQALFVAASLPMLLPAEWQHHFRNQFDWGVLYLAGSLLVLYPTLGRFWTKRAVPKRLHIRALLVPVIALPMAYILEGREISTKPQLDSLAGLDKKEAEATPNVLLVVLDTLRYDTLHATWEGYQHFPQLDEYTKDAAKFERGYAGSNVTPGGHSTLFTGLFPAESGTLPKGLVRLDESLLTISEFLQSYGYRTGATVTNARVSGRFGYRQGFEVYDDSLVNTSFQPSDAGERFGRSSIVQLLGAPFSRKLIHGSFKSWKWHKPVPTAADTSRTALAMVDKMGLGEDEPWYLFLNYIDPHTPYLTREDLAEAFGPGYESEEFHQVRRNTLRFTGRVRNLQAARNRGEEHEAALNWLQEVYREQCLELDEGVMMLLTGLRERKLLDENTLILFTSDHGEHLGEHNEYHHGSTLLDEEVRVPFLLKGPGIKPGPEGIPVSGADFFATVCYAMGLEDEAWPNTEGWPMQTPRPGRVIRFEHGSQRGILIDNHKMIAEDRNGELTWIEAYDLVQDPKELRNLINEDLPWIQAIIKNPPIRSSQDAERVIASDGTLNLADLGYADEVSTQ
jgi:arylsulfatase A-like enzyme